MMAEQMERTFEEEVRGLAYGEDSKLELLALALQEHLRSTGCDWGAAIVGEMFTLREIAKGRYETLEDAWAVQTELRRKIRSLHAKLREVNAAQQGGKE